VTWLIVPWAVGLAYGIWSAIRLWQGKLPWPLRGGPGE